LILAALILIIVIPGFAASSPAASPAQAPAAVEKTETACSLLDDPAARQKMSGMFETKLLYACGRTDELGKVTSPAASAPNAPLLGTDVQVNDSTGETGATATQSETSLARNENTGTLCSGYNDAYSGVVLGQGYTGFSNSTDGGATFVDRGALDANSFGDPSMIWRRSDGKFYFAALHSNGLGIWRTDDDCQTFVFQSMIHTGSGDDKELLAVDNNIASPYYGRIYNAWIDFNAGSRIYVTYSDDGTTWSTPVAVSAVAASVQGAWPAVAPNGDVVVSWVRWNPYFSGPIDIEVVRSTNGGTSFSAVTNPLTGAVNPYDNTATSSCGRPALNGNIRYLPSGQIAVSPNGDLHVVYSYDPDGFNTGDVVDVFYRRSTDNGATWNPEVLLNDDGTTTDQWFPTVSAGPTGRIVATWYDRRLDTGSNLLFDYYMRVSEDGGATWQPSVRVTDTSSPVYIDPGLAACYHGDYDTQIQDAAFVYIQWSDDRNILSAHNDPDVWMDTNAFAPDFTLDASPLAQDVCIPDDAAYDLTIGQVQSFTDPVTLSTAGTPAGTTSAFSVNPVIPPGTSVLTLGTASASAGSYSFDVVGVAPTSTHTVTVGLDLLDAVPAGTPTLVAPADGATLVPLAPIFEWTAAAGASSYTLEVATDAGFTNIVYTATVVGTNHTAASNLAAGTLHYWQVTPLNACGGGSPSSTFAFTTLVPPSIDLAKTVGTTPGVCATTDAITVTAGTDVYYCYEVTNTGPITLAFHDLVDSELGNILSGFPYNLAPGASVDTIAAGLTLSATLNATTVNTATWTAFNLPYNYDDTAPYGFVDITGTGTPLGLVDDGEADVTMPFTFNFFGTESDQLCIGNNGGVLFDQSGCSLSFSNGSLPNAGLGLAILPFWDDIDADTGDVYYETQGSAPNRQFIVQWDDRPHFSNIGSATFEVILYEGSNQILFQYQDLDFGDATYDYGASATVGLNKDGVEAVQYSYNSAVLSDNMAILFIQSSGSATATDTALVTVATPEITVSPLALTSTQAADAQFTYPLTIMNVGLLPLDWSIDEAPAPAQRNPAVEAGGQPNYAAPVVTSADQCGLYANYAGAEPEGYADFCLAGFSPVPSGSLIGRDPTDTAFAQDIGFVSDNFVSHALNDFPGQAVIGPNARPIYAMDFDQTATTLYAIDNTSRELGTYDLATGAFTPIAVVSGIPPADNISGLTIDPATGTAYVSGLGAAMTLYTLDLGTAVATPIGSDATVTLLIDIAIGPQGVIYGHDVGTDTIYTIDKTTGTATPVGLTGVDSNFAQGLDFDNTDGTLYAYTYQGGGANQYGTIDLATGALTPLAIDNPLGEFEGATQTAGAPSACDAPSDLDWVSVDPLTGTTGAGLSTVLDVTFDSTGKSAGVYTGTLCVNSNDLTDPLVEVPLSLVVVGSPSYGVTLSPDMALTGTVGTTVTYTLQITNTGDVADVFDLAASGNAWTTMVSPSSVTLYLGQTSSFTVLVAVPAGASNNATDTVTITATSQGDPGASDSADLTTTAFRQETLLYLPIIPKIFP
jgi:hypothetical protein